MQIFRIGCGLFLLVGASWAQQYVISTVAGGAPPPTPVAGTSAVIGEPVGVATDASGNVYFASLNNCVFKLDKTGLLTRVAGNSRRGYSGDGGPATNAQINLSPSFPDGLAVDSGGNIYVADSYNNLIRRVSPSGIITTVAGGGLANPGDRGPATNAALNGPSGVALDAAGNLYIAETLSNRVRKVSPSGIITTIAGSGTAPGNSGDGGPATSAQLNIPRGVAVDGTGNVYIADGGEVRKVSPSGVITAAAALPNTVGVAVDAVGNLYVADLFNSPAGQVLKVSPSGVITTVSNGSSPLGIAVDTAGDLYVADEDAATIIKISSDGTVATVLGNGSFYFSGDGGPATSAQLFVPSGVAADGSGSLYIADSWNNRIRKVSASGIITTIAGNGTVGYSGDGGPAISAQLSLANEYNSLPGIAVDAAGDLYIADFANNRIRKVSPGGIITTIAGNGTAGYSGDGGTATSAAINGPAGVAVDAAGNLYVADQLNNRIRKVSPSGIITTFVGTGVKGYSGDRGPATSAQLAQPGGIAVDAANNVWIADSANNAVRKVSAGTIATIAGGNCCSGFNNVGDGGQATNAQLWEPTGVAVDTAGNLYIADDYDERIRKVSPDGVISTLVGYNFTTLSALYTGDGGPATSASLYVPSGIAVGIGGNLFIADSQNNSVRLLRPVNQNVLVSAVLDAASESAVPVSPGKIVVIYGGGLGPSQGVTASPSNGLFGTQLSGTTVSVNGFAAPVYYTSATQVNAIVPYATSGTTASISVAYQGGISSAFSVPLAASSPSLFTANSTGAGQAAAVNVVDGTLNSAANPVKIGAYISFYATGEGQTTPAGVDGKLGTVPLPSPNLPVTATVGGIPAVVQYKGDVFGVVAGLMQVNVQIPAGVTLGGYVPVVLTVGNASTVNGAVWIAVSN